MSAPRTSEEDGPSGVAAPSLPATAVERPRTGLATALLTLGTAAWGSSFFLTRDLVSTVPVTDYLAVRFALAAAVAMVALHRHVRALTRRDVVAGLGLGVVYGVAQILQTEGLARTTATRSGFVTGMYVILTPLLAALVLRVRQGASLWLASVLAVAGLAALSLGSLGWGLGETLTLASAAVYAVQILWLGHASRPGATLGLSAVQLVAIAVVCGVAGWPGGVRLPDSGGGWASLLYLALVCGAAVLWIQTWAQAHLPPTRAAVVMTTEPVFAALFAIAFGGEELTWRTALGGALILAAMYVAELGPRRADAPAARDVPGRRSGVPTEALHHEPGA